MDSDRLNAMPLPDDGPLLKIETALEVAMKTADSKGVGQVFADFLGTSANFYQVPQCTIRVLAARPLRGS